MSIQDAQPNLLDTSPRFRDYVASLPDERCSAGFFEACLRPIVYSRHHWLKYKGEYHVRADLRRLLEELQSRDPHQWDDQESDFILSLYALSVAAVGLDDLKDRVDTAAVRDVLAARLSAYAAVAEPSAGSGCGPSGLVEL